MAATEQKKHTKGQIVGNENASMEAIMGLLSGMAYGLINPLVGHPFNLVQTRMQADVAFKNSGAIATARTIMKTEGLRGFWRGLIPPLMGSTAYRGVLFSAYSAAFAACKETPLSKPLPLTGGLAPAVLVGAVAASTARTAVETPLELIKVRRMLKQPWMTGSGVSSLFSVSQFLELYKGSSATWARSTGMLVTFFTLIDYSTRYFPVAVATPIIGPFIKGGLCTTIGWAGWKWIGVPPHVGRASLDFDHRPLLVHCVLWSETGTRADTIAARAVAWPAEVVKSRVQGDTTGQLSKKSTIRLIQDVARQV